LNAPLVSLLFAPLAAFDTRTSFLFWSALGLALWTLALQRIARVADQPLWAVWGVTGSMAAIYAGLRLGQVNLLVAAWITGAWWLDRQGRSNFAAVLLGIAAYSKPFVALVGFMWLLRGDWRAVLLSATSALGLGAATLVFFPDATYAWLELLRHTTWYAPGTNMSVVGWLTRVGWPTLLVGAPLLLSVAIIARHRFDWSRDQQWAAWLLTAFVVSPLAWITYLPASFGPMAGVWREQGNRPALVAGALLFAVPPVVDDVGRLANPWIAGTLGSVYTAGLVLWWIGTFTARLGCEPRREHP